MKRKILSAIMAVPLAIGFCTAGHKGFEPCVDYTPRESITINCPLKKDPYVVKNLGAFRLTFYTPYEDEWGYQTATGVKSQHLATCAVDPSIIPYGSVIKIVGNNGRELILKAVDTGNFKGQRIVDIFFDGTQREGYAFMAQFGEIHNVYLMEE